MPLHWSIVFSEAVLHLPAIFCMRDFVEVGAFQRGACATFDFSFEGERGLKDDDGINPERI